MNARTSRDVAVLAWFAMEKPFDPFNLPDAALPSLDAYKKAFLACKGALRSIGGRSVVREILSAHYRAPAHTVTAGELAAQLDLTSYGAVNSQYGKYASALCDHFSLMPKIQLAILVSFSGGVPGDEFVKWTMLPRVVTALEELAWVKKT